MFVRGIISAIAIVGSAIAASHAMAAVQFQQQQHPAQLKFLSGHINPLASGWLHCTVVPAVGSTIAELPLGISKSAALLGDHTSRLEAMARQQSGEAVVGLASSSYAKSGAEVGACGNSAGLVRSVLPAPLGMAATSQLAGPADYLGSKRLAVSHTSFDAAWDRVSKRSLPDGLVQRLARQMGQVDLQSQVAAVNSWTNAKIRYVEDSKLYGKADYWADASTTLRRRAGDCEDIAIVKMQLLAAQGIARSDMYLTIARDLARHADHAMLVVRLNGKFVLLDNATNELIDANASLDYRPIFSFSGQNKWLHGY